MLQVCEVLYSRAAYAMPGFLRRILTMYLTTAHWSFCLQPKFVHLQDPNSRAIQVTGVLGLAAVIFGLYHLHGTSKPPPCIVNGGASLWEFSSRVTHFKVN